MEQITKSTPQKSTTSQCSLLSNERPRLTTMLLQQLHIGDGHAPVDGFAHVINGQQGELDGGQGLHLDAGLADGFDGGVADDAVGFFVGIELNGDPCQSQRVAERNQVAGFFGRHDAGDARDAEHVALFSRALQNNGQRGGMHDDAALCHRDPVSGGFGGHVDHVGLALGVKMCQCGGGGHVVSRSVMGTIIRAKLYALYLPQTMNAATMTHVP